MVLRRMLSDKYQDCCLVLSNPDILFILSLHVVWFLLERTYGFEELLEEFQDGCLMHGHL